MKIKNIIKTIFFALFCAGSVSAADMAYLKIGIQESFMMNAYQGQDALSLGFANGIVADIGYKHDLDEKSELLFIYELNYDGPGLKGASKESFNARGLDHYLLTKYTQKMSHDASYYLKADFFYEFYRISKNEDWSDGLYNFGKAGVGFGMDFETSVDNKLGFSAELHYFWFPNYTDLSREAVYLLGTTGSQLSADSVNQNFIQLLLRAEDTLKLSNNLQFVFGLNFIYRYYPTLKIDENTLTPSNTKQKDFLIEGIAGLTYFISQDLSWDVKYSLSYFKSNYNYLYLDVNNFSNSTLIKNFSSFIEHKLVLPLNYALSPKNILSVFPGLEYKQYIGRPAKDINSSYSGQDEQYQAALTAGISLTYKKHENFSVVPQYIFKWAKSNNQDLMSGYNYKAHYLGIQFIFEY